MKKLISLFVVVMLIFVTTACTQKASILFNQRPITKENVTDYTSVFAAGQRVYYLILMPEIQRSKILNIQIIKKGSKDYLGYSLYITRTVRLKNEEEKYYTDYFVINDKGSYIMKVYSKDNPTQVLTQAEFYVK